MKAKTVNPMIDTTRKLIMLTALIGMPLLSQDHPPADAMPMHPRVQSQAVLTVAEGKRLIAKAVASLPAVRRARENGMIIICKGTTNTYVAEEILGEALPRGPYVLGRIYPAKGGQRLDRDGPAMNEIVLVNGTIDPSLSLADAVKELKPGDVVIKGANALDHQHQVAGVLIGAPNSGTTGTIMPYVVARKAHLIIPIGLEKQVAEPLVDIAARMREPLEDLTRVPSMFLLRGTIVTELEAIQQLAGVQPFQAAAGGIGGAEGATWIVYRGSPEQVAAADEMMAEVHGEPPFVQ